MQDKKIRVAIDCDDAAVELKSIIYNYLADALYEIVDLAYSSNHNVDYPDIGYNLAMKVKNGEFDRGILLCGTGIGMAIVANKVEGIYAAPCHDVYSAERLKKSNNGQILTMGARVIGPELAKTIVSSWLLSDFQEERSGSKVNKVKLFEEQSFHTVKE